MGKENVCIFGVEDTMLNGDFVEGGKGFQVIDPENEKGLYCPRSDVNGNPDVRPDGDTPCPHFDVLKCSFANSEEYLCPVRGASKDERTGKSFSYTENF